MLIRWGACVELVLRLEEIQDMWAVRDLPWLEIQQVLQINFQDEGGVCSKYANMRAPKKVFIGGGVFLIREESMKSVSWSPVKQRVVVYQSKLMKLN